MNNYLIPVLNEVPGQLRAVKIYKNHRDAVARNFKELYRFEERNINFLIREFLPEYHETRGGAVTNYQKLKSFLRYVGDPGFQVFLILLDFPTNTDQ